MFSFPTFRANLLVSHHCLASADPCHTTLRRRPRGSFSDPGVGTGGVRHSPDCCDLCRVMQCRAHSVAAHPSPSPPMCRGEMSLQKWIVLHGGVATTLTSIALHCATFRANLQGDVLSQFSQFSLILWKL